MSHGYIEPVPEPDEAPIPDCRVCGIRWERHLDLATVSMPGLREGDPPKQYPRGVGLGDCVTLLLKEAGRG